MTALLTRMCPTCGEEFQPARWTGGVYCSVPCRRAGQKGETAAILPSETKPMRTKPMTDEEFTAYLAMETRRLLDAGEPLFRDDLIAVSEKAARIAAAKER